MKLKYSTKLNPLHDSVIANLYVLERCIYVWNKYKYKYKSIIEIFLTKSSEIIALLRAHSILVTDLIDPLQGNRKRSPHISIYLFQQWHCKPNTTSRFVTSWLRGQ